MRTPWAQQYRRPIHLQALTINGCRILSTHGVLRCPKNRSAYWSPQKNRLNQAIVRQSVHQGTEDRQLSEEYHKFLFFPNTAQNPLSKNKASLFFYLIHRAKPSTNDFCPDRLHYKY